MKAMKSKGTQVLKVTFLKINIKLAEKNKYIPHSVQGGLEMCEPKIR